MTERMNQLQVNWVDGMKINKNHFIAQDQSVSDRIEDVRLSGLTPYNYGLLPGSGDAAAPVKYVIFADNQQTIRVKVSECEAITPGGARISISESVGTADFQISLPEAVYELSPINQEDLFVALSVNPAKRIPTGKIDPGEEPPRHPYTGPAYQVHLIPASQLGRKESGTHLLLIGKVHLSEKGPVPDEEYIPPCTRLACHPKLMALHTGFDKFLSQLETDLVTIIRKIRDKEQTNSLATTLATIAEPLLYFLSTHLTGFRWDLPGKPPVDLCTEIAGTARIIRNALDSNAGKNREELLNYFTEWCTLNQGDFESILHRTVNFEYQHSDLYPTLAVMLEYAGVISPLFSKLSTLEYIGKKKETSIFVKEQTVKKSFLAD